MIYLAILRRAAPFLIVIGLVAGAWWKYSHDVTAAYEDGKAEVLEEWRESDRLAREVGAAQSALLARNALILVEKFNAKISDLEQLLAARKRELAARSAVATGLRDELAKRAATPPSGDASPAACGRHERLRRVCEGLLGEGVELAREADSLAGEGEEVSRRGGLVLERLQDWTRVIEAFQP